MLFSYESVEYVVLDPLVIDNQIDKAAQLAARLQIGGLCVPPYWVKKASRELANTSVHLTTVLGYPLGYQRTEAKVAEMELAFADGARALELIINMSAFKSQRTNWIKAEIARFANLIHACEAMLTVITETEYLDEKEIETFCKLSADAGADYVKPVSGFLGKDTTITQITQLKKLLPASVGIKAYLAHSSRQQIEALLEAGAQKVNVTSLEFLQAN